VRCLLGLSIFATKVRRRRDATTIRISRHSFAVHIFLLFLLLFFYSLSQSYADELRELSVEQDFEAATPDVKQCLAATSLSECLVSEFESELFPNPSLQKHFAVLQTYALGKKEILKGFEDTLLPDVEGMSHFKQQLDEFKETLGYEAREGEGEGEKKKKVTKKRSNNDGEEEEQYEGDWNELLSSDANMKTVTIPLLKAKLKQEGKKHILKCLFVLKTNSTRFESWWQEE
jgi:hypothetical protein